MKEYIKGVLVFFWEILKITILALLIVIPIRYFLFQPFLVKGQSMEPNFQEMDYLIIDEISYRLRDPQRGEVIVFKYPDNPSQRYIKRIIGLPGEKVEIKNGKIKIFETDQISVLDESKYLPSSDYTSGNIGILLKENEYFVLGDNRSSSFDSRRFGALERDYIIGKVLLRAWPITALAKIEAPAY